LALCLSFAAAAGYGFRMDRVVYSMRNGFVRCALLQFLSDDCNGLEVAELHVVEAKFRDVTLGGGAFGGSRMENGPRRYANASQ